MDPFILSFIYGGLFLAGLGVGINLILNEEYWPGIVALILGAIALEDTYSWFFLREAEISSGTLDLIDLMGVLAGGIAVTAPGAAAKHPRKSLIWTVVGSSGYMLACVLFWLFFRTLDPVFYGFLESEWKLTPGEGGSYSLWFVFSLLVLLGFLLAVWKKRLDATQTLAWKLLALALFIYLCAYTVIGPTSRLLFS